MNKSLIVDIISVTCLLLLLINSYFLGSLLWLKLALIGIMVCCLIFKIRTRDQHKP